MEGLALGAASGKSNAVNILRKTSLDGERMPTVESPAVAISGTISFFWSSRVSGPGQKRSASFSAFSSMKAYLLASLMFETCRMTGFVAGLPLRLNIFFKATGFIPFAARP